MRDRLATDEGKAKYGKRKCIVEPVLEHPERPENKWRTRDGFTPGYRAFHEVYITKDFGPERNEELVAFIGKHIAEYKGKTEDKHGIPLMLFDRRQDAQKFANEFSARLNVPKEHITIKARKYTR